MASSAFEYAADVFDPPILGAARWHDDPRGFALECIKWEHDEAPTEYQLRNLDLLVTKKRVAVRGPHGLGKTTGNAIAILWFSLTRDAAGEDWKCPTTASSWRQLTKYLWPEVKKWARKIDWEKVGRRPFTKLELMALGLKLRTGEAFAVACEDPATIEGVHADQVLYIYDEAKTIPEGTFDASEGAFSGAGEDTKAEAYAIASSTPGPPTGRFYDIHQRAAGLEDWHAVHVTLTDVVKAGRVSTDWAEQRKRQWGASSGVYINRVLGEFAPDEADGVIPLAWLEAANERWRNQKDERLDRSADGPDPLEAVGVDIARSGKDKTVFALRHGHVVTELRHMRTKAQLDTMETVNTLHGLLEGNHHVARSVKVVIDVIGIGGPVVDRLREVTMETVIPFGAAETSLRRDRSGELGFVNNRAAAWWNLREMLDPAFGLEVAIPDDDKLTGDLTAPQWRVMAGGRIQIESKDDLFKRIGRSTDDGDAVVMCFWPEGGISLHAPIFAATPGVSRWAIN